MMEYKGYLGKVDFDPDGEILHGEVVGIRDVVTFQGTSVDEVRQAFQDSVDDYLEFCEERGEKPERPCSGRFVLRISPELHRQITMLAAASGESLNSWVAECLKQEVATSALAPQTPGNGGNGTKSRRRRQSRNQGERMESKETE